MVDQPCDEGMLGVLRLAQHHRQEVVERALFDEKTAIHIEFAEPQIGVDDKRPLRCKVGKADMHAFSGPVAEAKLLPIGCCDIEGTAGDDARKRTLEDPIAERRGSCFAMADEELLAWPHHRSLLTWACGRIGLASRSLMEPGFSDAPAISQTPARIRPLPTI